MPDPAASRSALPILQETTKSTVVLVWSNTAIFIDVDSRQLVERHMQELSAGDPIERIVAGDQLVLYGGPTTYVMEARADAAPRPLINYPQFSTFVKSGLTDRVWIRSGVTDGSPAEIVQMGLDGEVLLGPAQSPGGNLVAGLRDLAILQRENRLIAWDPDASKIVATVPGEFPMGTDGRRFAWCDSTCRVLFITDPSIGTTQMVATLPTGVVFDGYSGEISPNGRYISAPVCLDADTGRHCGLTVLDLEGERTWTVADGWLSTSVGPAWSADSRWIFMYLTDGRLAAYRPGDHEVSVIDIHPIAMPNGLGVASARP